MIDMAVYQLRHIIAAPGDNIAVFRTMVRCKHMSTKHINGFVCNSSLGSMAYRVLIK